MPAPVDISDPFRALSDPKRREILSLLASGALPVRLIADHFPEISRPAVSKHLRILREGGLVSEARSGRERYYSVEDRAIEGVLGWVTGIRERSSLATSEAASARAAKAPKARPAPAAETRRRGDRIPARRSRTKKRPSTAPEETPPVDVADWKAW